MRFFKWFFIVFTVLGILFFFVARPYMQKQTKKHSPEKTVTYIENGMDLSVQYSSPSKKDRIIFGELVPYDTVWRTGANEPTTFTTSTDIKIEDKKLPAGTYSIWTRPTRQSWSIIFNKDVPDWGVTILSGGKETTRVPEKDILEVERPTEELPKTVENFTIDFYRKNHLYMRMTWDRTQVKILIGK